MPISPATLVGLYPDMDPMKAAALSQATGFTPPPAPAPAPPLVPTVTPPQASILNPADVPPAAPPPPAAAIPATLDTSSISRQSGGGTSVTQSGVAAPTRQEAQQLMRQGIASGDEALNYQTKAAEIRAPAREEAAQAKFDVAREAMAGLSSAQANYAPKIEAAHQDLRNAMQDAASGRIDPNRIWHDKGNGAVALAAISQALGAFGAGITHSPNTAADIIQNAVNRDVQAQEQDLAKKQWKVGLAKDALSEAVQKYGSLPAAIEAQKAQKLAYIDSQLALQEAKANTFEQAQSIAKTREELKDRQQKNLVAFDKAVNPNVTSSSTSSTTRSVSSKPEGTSQEVSDKLASRYVPELGGYARTPDAAAKLRETTAMANNIKDNMKQMIEIRKNASKLDLKNPNSQAYQQLEGLKAETLQILTVYRGQGVLSGHDEQLGTKALGNARNLFGDPEAQMNAFIKRIDQQTTNRAKAEGIQVGKEALVPNAAGQLVPQANLTGREQVGPVPPQLATPINKLGQ